MSKIQRHQSRSKSRAMADLKALSGEAGELYLILTPDLTIVDASDAYLRATLTRHEEIRGCRMFDVFPDNPHDPTADGVHKLRQSLNHVLLRREPDRMPTQRYDVRDRLAGDGSWVEKSWAPVNSPVFASGSRELTHILHRVQDVTRAVFLRRGLEEESQAIAEQLATLEQMRRELLIRNRETRAQWESIDAMLRAGRLREPLLASLPAHLAIAPSRQYWAPAERAPVNGIYDVYHDRPCELGLRKAYVRAGQPFGGCPGCRGEVLYRLVWKIR